MWLARHLPRPGEIATVERLDMPQPDRAVARSPADATPRAPDRAASRSWLRALELTARLGEEPLRTFPCVIDELADRFGNATALIDEQGRSSFRDLAERANRYARWALSRGLEAGEVVCLSMPNRADYLVIAPPAWRCCAAVSSPGWPASTRKPARRAAASPAWPKSPRRPAR